MKKYFILFPKVGFLLCLFYETGHGVGILWSPIIDCLMIANTQIKVRFTDNDLLLFFCRRKDFGAGNLCGNHSARQFR